MWQFAEACRGLKDGCLELGIPVTGGNVSLYNQTGETAILPTPVVAVLGVIDDVTKRTPTGFVAAGERVFLLGETREELSGSEWAHVVHGHLGGLPPRVDLAAEQALAALLADASRDAVVTSAHDLSDGGLAQALAEASFRNGVGVSVSVADVAGGDAFVALFSESAARAIVTVTTDNADRARRPGRAPRRTPHADRADRRRRDLASRASSTSPSPSCATPGAPRCPTRWAAPPRIAGDCRDCRDRRDTRGEPMTGSCVPSRRVVPDCLVASPRLTSAPARPRLVSRHAGLDPAGWLPADRLTPRTWSATRRRAGGSPRWPTLGTRPHRSRAAPTVVERSPRRGRPEAILRAARPTARAAARSVATRRRPGRARVRPPTRRAARQPRSSPAADERATAHLRRRHRRAAAHAEAVRRPRPVRRASTRPSRPGRRARVLDVVTLGHAPAGHASARPGRGGATDRST